MGHIFLLRSSNRTLQKKSFTNIFESLFTVARWKIIAKIALRQTAICIAFKVSRSSEQRVVLHQSTNFSTRSQTYFRLLDDFLSGLFTMQVQGHAGDVDQGKDHGRETNGRVFRGGKALGELCRRREHHFSNV